jgi:hypothetical protein
MGKDKDLVLAKAAKKTQSYTNDIKNQRISREPLLWKLTVAYGSSGP